MADSIEAVSSIEVDPAAPPAPEPESSEPQVVATPEVAPNERPDWLPDEFSSPEQMAEAYKHMKAGDAPAPEDSPSETPAEDAAPDADEPDAVGVQSIVESAGLDFDELSTAWQANGELSEAHYAAFQEKMGLNRTIIDDFLLGQEARVAAHASSILEAVGGEKEFNAAAEWAANNLSESEQATYNEAVNSGNFERAKAAAQGLVLKFRATQGSEPNFVEADGPAVQASNGYRSRAEITTAMADPRYEVDEAYRADVQQRLAATPSSLF
jgi:hypothetical protein